MASHQLVPLHFAASLHRKQSSSAAAGREGERECGGGEGQINAPHAFPVIDFTWHQAIATHPRAVRALTDFVTSVAVPCKTIPAIPRERESSRVGRGR